jgi:hypothetical protein
MSHYNLSFQMQNISDKGLRLIASNYQGLKKLNITRYCSIFRIDPSELNYS